MMGRNNLVRNARETNTKSRMSCLLGVVDSRISHEEKLSWDTNKIGGNVVTPSLYTNLRNLKISCVCTLSCRFSVLSCVRPFDRFAHGRFVLRRLLYRIVQYIACLSATGQTCSLIGIFIKFCLHNFME